MDSKVILRGQNLRREFSSGDTTVTAVKNCTVEIAAHEFVAIVGKSGSGKSTLVNLLSGLDVPTSGTVTLLGKDLSTLSEKELAGLRARHIGFVLQKDNLVPSLTIEENVAAPLVMGGTRLSVALRRARATLDDVGLGHRADRWPSEVSDGEAQRAAVARACAGSPAVVFADEPTGALDEENGKRVREIFRRLTAEHGAAGVIITHDMDLADEADIIITISNGETTGRVDRRT
ncbi:ABC transporter ATP-binding protein [Streptomyces sp. Inha503]|uniref:ABC transporter ATP-binding protein n=1 Tax=Streptomyces sp. Inha503 TaxID=3383314 RepID=UPI00399F4C9C